MKPSSAIPSSIDETLTHKDYNGYIEHRYLRERNSPPLTSSTKHLCCCILVQHTLHWHTSFSFKFSALSLSRVAVTWGGGGGTGGGSGLVATSRLSELELWRRGGVMFVTFAFPCETWCFAWSADLPAAECSRSLPLLPDVDLDAACDGDR